MKNIPTRSEIRSKIFDLINGNIDRRDIAQWAESIILDDGYDISDRLSWDVLTSLGAIEIPDGEGGFLYGIEDFEEWKKLLT